MRKGQYMSILWVAVAALGIWLAFRFALPVGFPFLVGAAVALGAEPLVGLLNRKAGVPRWAAAGVGVLTVMALLGAVTMLLIALLIRQAGNLTKVIPDLTDAVQTGLGSLQGWLTELSYRAPAGVRPVLHASVENLFSGSGAAVDRMTDKVIDMASNILSRVPDSALGISTAVLAAFMISARLPKLKKQASSMLSGPFREKYLPAFLELKHSVGGWLLAELKLSGVTAVLLFLGFWALRIPYFPLWAILTAFVDALPVLGTGAVLVPWSVVCFLQGQTVRGVGLLGVYALVWLVRSVLEPKFVGSQLGLDPLVTLASMYAGYKLFGLLGLILTPVATVCAIRLLGVFRQ